MFKILKYEKSTFNLEAFSSKYYDGAIIGLERDILKSNKLYIIDSDVYRAFYIQMKGGMVIVENNNAISQVMTDAFNSGSEVLAAIAEIGKLSKELGLAIIPADDVYSSLDNIQSYYRGKTTDEEARLLLEQDLKELSHLVDPLKKLKKIRVIKAKFDKLQRGLSEIYR